MTISFCSLLKMEILKKEFGLVTRSRKTEMSKARYLEALTVTFKPFQREKSIHEFY